MLSPRFSFPIIPPIPLPKGGVAIYTFGNNEFGQLGRESSRGIGMIEDVYGPTYVTCGWNHTAYIDDHYLLTFGKGISGQLGHGKIENLRVPEEVAINGARNNVFMVACGENHTTAITLKGDLYTWGDGKDGQLGHGNIEIKVLPTLVKLSFPEDVGSVSCGSNHTGIVTVNGKVWMFGNNQYGQLGLGDTQNRLFPTLLPGAFTMISEKSSGLVLCGGYHTAILSADHQLYTFGLGNGGQLGHGDTMTHSIPKQVMSLVGKSVKFAACGFNHTAVIVSNGKNVLYTFGNGEHGQLGHNNRDSQLLPKALELFSDDIIQVSCGSGRAAFISSKFKLFTFGRGGDMCLGYQQDEDQLIPREVLEINNAIYVSCGMNHMAVVVTTITLLREMFPFLKTPPPAVPSPKLPPLPSVRLPSPKLPPLPSVRLPSPPISPRARREKEKSRQCKGMTQEGFRCLRKVIGGDYCWQHSIQAPK